MFLLFACSSSCRWRSQPQQPQQRSDWNTWTRPSAATWQSYGAPGKQERSTERFRRSETVDPDDCVSVRAARPPRPWPRRERSSGTALLLVFLRASSREEASRRLLRLLRTTTLGMWSQSITETRYWSSPWRMWGAKTSASSSPRSCSTFRSLGEREWGRETECVWEREGERDAPVRWSYAFMPSVLRTLRWTSDFIQLLLQAWVHVRYRLTPVWTITTQTR